MFFLVVLKRFSIGSLYFCCKETYNIMIVLVMIVSALISCGLLMIIIFLGVKLLEFEMSIFNFPSDFVNSNFAEFQSLSFV